MSWIQTLLRCIHLRELSYIYASNWQEAAQFTTRAYIYIYTHSNKVIFDSWFMMIFDERKWDHATCAPPQTSQETAGTQPSWTAGTHHCEKSKRSPVLTPETPKHWRSNLGMEASRSSLIWWFDFPTALKSIDFLPGSDLHEIHLN